MTDVSAFANDFQNFLRSMHEQAPSVEGPLRARVREHVGADPSTLPVIGEEVAVYNRVNLQLALDAWVQAPGRTIEAVGYGSANRFMGVELGDLVGVRTATGVSIEVAPVNYVEAELPGGALLRCIDAAILLMTDGAQRFVGLVARGSQRSAAPRRSYCRSPPPNKKRPAPCSPSFVGCVTN